MMKEGAVLKLDEGKEYTLPHLRSMSVEQLSDVLRDASVHITHIASQQREARGDYAAEGKGSDWDWYKRAGRAKRILIEWQQEIASLRKARRKTEHENRNNVYEQCFIEAARELLPKTQYNRIVDLATERTNDVAWVG